MTDHSPHRHPAPIAPAHDKTRQFRAGDIVRPCQRDGREPWGYTDTSRKHLDLSCKLTVLQDEARGMVKCQTDSGFVFETSPFFLELFTPVEEPYSVGESTDYFCVEKNDEELSTYWKDTHPNPKAGAEAECARLNAEWRKEWSHD